MAALWATGCSVADSASFEGAPETGSTGNACSDGCLCVDEICQARTTELDTLVVEVSFPSGLSVVPGQKFVTVLEGVGRGDGTVDIELGNVSRVVGAIRGAAVSAPSCTPLPDGGMPTVEPDGSFPARVSILPRTRLLGLNAPVTVVDSVSDGASNVFSATVPPGAYDFYVEPLGSDVACLRPPYLVVNQQVKPGDLELKLTLPEPKPLSLVVEFVGEAAALDGFEVAVVDSSTGRVLSNTATLASPEWFDTTARYATSLVYSSVQGALSSKIHELVRLSPPADVDFPVLYVERAVAELFQPGTAALNQILEVPKPIVVRGSVGDGENPSPRAKVVFGATEVAFVAPGTLFSYVRETETDEDGTFEIEVLPGKYRILVEPTDPEQGQASFERTFEDDTADVEFATGDLISLASRALSARQSSLALVPFEASPVLPMSGFSDMLVPTSAARAFRGMTDATGAFSTFLDPGEYAITFRPDVGTGLPWLVLPSVRLSAEATSFLSPVGSLPVGLKGEIVAADAGVVPSATVRFYALLSGDRLVDSVEEATRAVPVAEARTDDVGFYRALLPSSIASTASTMAK